MSFTYRALREASHLCAKYQIETDSINVYAGRLHLLIDLQKFKELFPSAKAIKEGNFVVYIQRFNRVTITANETKVEPIINSCDECAGLGYTVNIIDNSKMDCESCDSEWVSLW